MSLQLRIRFTSNDPENDYESNLLSHAYELLDSLEGEVGSVNFLGKQYTICEDDLMEAIEEEIGDEPEDGDYEAYEEQTETELGRRGEFFAVGELIGIVQPWLAYFQERTGEEFRLDARHTTTGSDLVVDLQTVLQTLELSPSSRARFVIG